MNKIRNEIGEIIPDNTEIKKNHKRIIWTVIWQQIRQPGRNGQILRNAQPSETEPGRNRKYEQTNHKHGNWNCD